MTAQNKWLSNVPINNNNTKKHILVLINVTDNQNYFRNKKLIFNITFKRQIFCLFVLSRKIITILHHLFTLCFYFWIEIAFVLSGCLLKINMNHTKITELNSIESWPNFRWVTIMYNLVRNPNICGFLSVFECEACWIPSVSVFSWCLG